MRPSGVQTLTRTTCSPSTDCLTTASSAATAVAEPVTQVVGERGLDRRLGEQVRRRRGVVNGLALGDLAAGHAAGDGDHGEHHGSRCDHLGEHAPHARRSGVLPRGRGCSGDGRPGQLDRGRAGRRRRRGSRGSAVRVGVDERVGHLCPEPPPESSEPPERPEPEPEPDPPEVVPPWSSPARRGHPCRRRARRDRAGHPCRRRARRDRADHPCRHPARGVRADRPCRRRARDGRPCRRRARGAR